MNWASELGGEGERAAGARQFTCCATFPAERETAGATSEYTRRGSIPRELHRGMRGRIRRSGREERRGEGEGSFKATVNLSADAVSYARHFSLTVGGLGRGWPIPGTLFMEIKKGGWPKFSLRYRFQLFKTCNLTGQCTIEWYFYPKLDRAV